MVKGYEMDKDKDPQDYNLYTYKQIFEHAKEFKDYINLHAGFIPRGYVDWIEEHGEEDALKDAIEKGYIDKNVTELVGTDWHYNMWESMMNHRVMHGVDNIPSMPPIHPIYMVKPFKAYLIKDYAMAKYINEKLEAEDESEFE